MPHCRGAVHKSICNPLGEVSKDIEDVFPRQLRYGDMLTPPLAPNEASRRLDESNDVRLDESLEEMNQPATTNTKTMT